MVTKNDVLSYFKIRPDCIVINNNIVDIINSFDLRYTKTLDLGNLPFQFGEIDGNFIVENTGLTTMIGSPHTVGGMASYVKNKLTSLVGCPTKIINNLYLSMNPLETVKDLPLSITLLSLDYSPKLPLLPLVGKQVQFFYRGSHMNDTNINDIFTKYINRTDRKAAILECQAELIEADYMDNALW